MDWIDKLYTSQLETRLRNFKWSSTTVANFACPICGDSATDKRKARGYIMSKKGQARMYCHNCGSSMTLGAFIETVDTNLAAEYRMEKFKDSKKQSKPSKDENIAMFKVNIKTEIVTNIDAPKVSTLVEEHPARLYIRSRLLDEKKFYYVENFPEWVSLRYPSMKNWAKVTQHPRVVLPIYNRDKKLIGLTGRSINGETPKYATIKLAEEDLAYGIDKVDFQRRVWVVEGPIDSMMIDNAVAAMTSSLTRLDMSGAKDVAYIFDNQPRNAEIIKLVEKAVFNGYQVVIFPDIFEYKDLNEAVQKGMSRKDLVSLLESNIYKGLEARMRLASWKKL